MSQQYPSQFGASDQYRNPNGTLPMPSPADIPRPQWYSANLPWSWRYLGPVPGNNSTGQPPGFAYEYQWTTPTFDLRPDLRSGQAGPKAGVPIWSSAARLYVQLLSNPNGATGQPPLVLPNLSATAVDYVSTTFNFSDTQGLSPQNTGWGVVNVSSVNMTAAFSPSPNAPSVLVGFSPPGTTLGFGDGYPIRYWRVNLNFTVLVESELPLPPVPLAAPAVVMQSSVY